MRRWAHRGCEIGPSNGDASYGTPFWCLLDVVPIKNEKREVVLFLASHKDITHTKMAELQICELPDRDANGNLDPEAPPANYGRRRSRAVLYQLSGHYKQDKIKTKLKLNNTLLQPTAAPLPEYKTAALKKSRFIVSHYGVFRSCWDWFILVATFYVAVVVPYNASFISVDRPSMVSDVVVEALFIIDIIINFRTTFVNKKGEVVSNSRSIAINYGRTWFIVDLLAALPFDLLNASNVYSGEDSGAGQIHLLKLTRLLRLARLLQKMDRYSQYSAMILTLLMLCFTLVAHWLACVLDPHAGGEAEGERGEPLMHAVVFGNVTAIIQRMYSRRSLYETKWRDLKDFLTLHQIPKEMKQRMQDYFQTMWSLNHGIDIHETLKEFPEELRGDVSMHLHREILQLPIFDAASQGCLKLLSLHIRSNFCAPGEYLIHKGDALQYIYYLCNGSMEVVQNGMVVAILGKGDLFGCDITCICRALGRWGGGRRAGCDVGAGRRVVTSNCDVKTLLFDDLEVHHMRGSLVFLGKPPAPFFSRFIIREYQQEFASDIQHDLTYNLREGYEAEVGTFTACLVAYGDFYITAPFSIPYNLKHLPFNFLLAVSHPGSVLGNVRARMEGGCGPRHSMLHVVRGGRRRLHVECSKLPGCSRPVFILGACARASSAAANRARARCPQQESDMNGVPSMTLPSISEDDENVPEEGETSPLSPPTRSPLHGAASSPRHAKFNPR
ncbi:Cyclic nucleotide-gated cation channel subunit A [Gryllus bimaculatus]|nr:Cyclic nucleotide-gated cation channel subunit A [Gryllus bimaculatus]